MDNFDDLDLGDQAYEEGKQAYAAGQAEYANPYGFGTEHQASWAYGYQAAEAEQYGV